MIAKCRGCKNQCEIISDNLCESCIRVEEQDLQDQRTKAAPAQVPVEGQPIAHAPHPQPKQSLQREKLLDYIISNADIPFINIVIKKITRELKDYGWIASVQQIPDEKVLLRMAVNLGYGKIDNEKEENKIEIDKLVEKVEDQMGEIQRYKTLYFETQRKVKQLGEQIDRNKPKTESPRRPGRPPKASNDRNKPTQSGKPPSVLST